MRAMQDARVREMVDSTFAQYDKNRDGVIDKDEMASMPGGLRRADRNGDGRITREELTLYFTEMGMRGRGGGPGPNGPPGSGASGSSSASTANARKSYRQLTPQERLPKNLPPWFVTKDVRQVGQITMAEFFAGEVMTDELAAKFTRYDLNNDGIITAEEAIKSTATEPTAKAEVANRR
jgi:Ca2+-binding EF-hand superfamily protein